MKSRSLLESLVILIISAGAYLLCIAYLAKKRSHQPEEKINRIDDSLKDVRQDTLMPDSSTVGMFGTKPVK